jgi:hypothetical protein
MKNRNKIYGFLMFATIISWLVIACQMDEQIVKDTTSTDTTVTSTLSLSQTSITMTAGSTAQLSISTQGAASSATDVNPKSWTDST